MCVCMRAHVCDMNNLRYQASPSLLKQGLSFWFLSLHMSASWDSPVSTSHLAIGGLAYNFLSLYLALSQSRDLNSGLHTQNVLYYLGHLSSLS